MRAPRLNDNLTPEKEKSEDQTPPSSFKGCYRTLKNLDISGNFLNATHLDAKTFFSIFDFLENIEDLNIEKLKFECFNTFKEQFLRDFVSVLDYKPYMNTLKKLNFNFLNPLFYEEIEMNEEDALFFLENILKNFPNLTELKIDFIEGFFRNYMKKSTILKKYQ